METRTALSARMVSKSFKGFRALHQVDLRVRKGSVHGIIGPNGAGKTTLMHVLTCTIRPSQGQVHLGDTNITGLSPAKVAKLGLVRSFQICAVFPQLSVLQNVRLALQRRQPGNYAFWSSNRCLRRLDEQAMTLINDVGLAPWSSHSADQLSYGRKRALEFATTLATEPRVLLLDEPMAGLGAEEIPRLADLIRRFAAGRTVVMVEHHLPAVSDLCDTVTAMSRGTVLATGTYAEVAAHEAVRSSYLGKGIRTQEGTPQ